MIYVASPFTSPLLTVQEERLMAIRQFTALCIAEGFPAFSPIVYFYPIAKGLQLPEDANYWHDINMAFLRKSEAIFVLRLTGWDQSRGVQVELKIAKALAIPVVHYGPDFKVIQ